MRQPSEKPVANGGWLHKLGADRVKYDIALQEALPDVRAARRPDDELDAVYRRYIGMLSLSPRHRAELAARGMTGEEITGRQYRTVPDGFTVPHGDLTGVPGFCQKYNRWRHVAPPGLMIPVLNENRQIVGFQVRLDNPDNQKYIWFSSRKSANAGARTHVAMPFRACQATQIWITEGPIKADIASERLGAPVLGVPGVNNWKSALETLQKMSSRPDRVVLAYDMDDHDNEHVRQHTQMFGAALKRNYKTFLARWYGEKGLDDALVAGHWIDIKRL
jgi:hypothetical protein